MNISDDPISMNLINFIIDFLATAFLVYCFCWAKKYIEKMNEEKNKVLKEIKNATLIQPSYVETIYKTAANTISESYKFQREIESWLFKFLFVTNGGGATAIAAFLGSDSGKFSIYVKGLTYSLLFFSFGVIFVILALCGAYFSQDFYTSTTVASLQYLQAGPMGILDPANEQNSKVYIKSGALDMKHGDSIRLFSIYMSGLSILGMSLGLLQTGLTLILW